MEKMLCPQYRQKYKNVIAIIDSTGGILRNLLQRQYLHIEMLRYGSCASDRFITEDYHILDKLQFGENLMADKGFKIIDH